MERENMNRILIKWFMKMERENTSKLLEVVIHERQRAE